MTIELVFETHSVTVDNERGIATGWLPGELSDQNRDLARDLGRRYRNTHPPRCQASGMRLRRAQRNAGRAVGRAATPTHRNAVPRRAELPGGRRPVTIVPA